MSEEPKAARKRIAIAGASGFVGRALIEALRADYDVIALTRAPGGARSDGVEMRSCDLFNMRDAERALAGADAAFYLVHSMMPSARLTQGRFDDMDLICADNFARGAKAHGVAHITYLGGLLPPPEDLELSRHLESRLEVERTLAAHGAAVTTLRAGLVVGAGGSSFQMMTRLVERLPFMVGPLWTRSLSQAIAATHSAARAVHATVRIQFAATRRSWTAGSKPRASASWAGTRRNAVAPQTTASSAVDGHRCQPGPTASSAKTTQEPASASIGGPTTQVVRVMCDA